MMLTGEVGTDTVEGGCTYLQTSDGTRYELVFARDIDASGPLPPGTTATVRGELATDMLSICQLGPIFVVREIVATSGR